MVRLNKFLADSGVASRRASDKLILENRVKVNGEVVNTLGFTLDPSLDKVEFDGALVSQAETYVYYMFNKPKCCLTTAEDDRGRKTVFDYVKTDVRVFPIGRLDYDSEGLLLLTNDGGLAYKLTHPRHEIGKTYVVKVEGELKESELAVLRNGVIIDGEKTLKCKVKLIEIKERISKVEIEIFEGKNRQIRKMLEAIGREVTFLKRVAVGNLKLGGLSRGGMRELSPYEVSYLKNL